MDYYFENWVIILKIGLNFLKMGQTFWKNYQNFENWAKFENPTKIWKSGKIFKIGQKFENRAKIWKSGKYLKIGQKFENWEKVWKLGKILKIGQNFENRAILKILKRASFPAKN